MKLAKMAILGTIAFWFNITGIAEPIFQDKKPSNVNIDNQNLNKSAEKNEVTNSKTSSSGLQPTILKVQDQSIFTPDSRWIYIPLHSSSIVVSNIISHQLKEIELNAEGNNFGFRSYRNGYFWDIKSLSTLGDETVTPVSILFKTNENSLDKSWERVAKIETTFGIPNYLIPLDEDDLFLALSIYFGFSYEGKGSFIAVFKLKDDELKFQKLVDLPFGDKSTICLLRQESIPTKAAPEESSSTVSRRLEFNRCIVQPASLRPDLWVPTILPNYLALAATKVGVIWFFSLKDGQCAKIVDLGSLDTDQMNKLDLLDHFLLATQPSRDNKLIALTRDPDALKFAELFCPPQGTSIEGKKAARARFQEIAEEMTTVKWWSIDPESGRKERIDQPGEFPDHAFFLQQTTMRFLVGPDGKIHSNLQGFWQETIEKMGIKSKELTQSGKSSSNLPQPTTSNPKGGSNPMGAVSGSEQKTDAADQGEILSPKSVVPVAH